MSSIRRILALAVVGLCNLTQAVDLDGYEYIVVGSGAGGGPVAARLALAGHKTLLIESGGDHGSSYNYTVPSYHGRMTEDPDAAWDFFVRHYADDARQARDWKASYDTPNGSIYTGLNPPPGSRLKGTLYPRSGTLGGCTAHNAFIAVYPHQSDFQYVATLTGDNSWSPENMRQHFVRMERKRYYTGTPQGHGTNGWLTTELTPLTVPLTDPQLLSLLTGGAFALGNLTNQVINIGTLLAGDLNHDSLARDQHPAYYQIPISTDNHARVGSREFIISVRDAKNFDGSKKYPLDVRLNCHVTKVTFDTTVSPPRATGVEFLDGQHLYRASKRSQTSNAGIPGSATASREVIISGGTYNSPQILKLSGVGPANELARFNIPLVVDLPGVGTNLQDHYETSLNVKVPVPWPTFAGCTFSGNPSTDSCLQQWLNPLPIVNDRGTYASSGVASAMLYKSTQSHDNAFDIFAFGGPINFRGYYPLYSTELAGPSPQSEHSNWWTWGVLKAHPRNRAGTVTLNSSDPLDVPLINYNYFDTGSGDYEADLQAMYEGLLLSRDALHRQVVPTNEILPGSGTNTEEEIKTYIKDGAWGHHASSTCPIGADDDPMAVLDSKFRVRGVTGLRVVDASVWPRIPGTFTAVSTYLVGEKAASDILGEL